MLNLYKVEPSEDGLTYTFTTRFNIKYTLALTTYFLGEVKAFSLSLYPETETVHFDYWIKNTVVQIIGDILLNDANVIFYICDNEDEREAKRYNVFEYWYQQAAKDYPYVNKYNHQLYSQNGYNLYSSILYNADNFLESYIIAEFKKALEIS